MKKKNFISLICLCLLLIGCATAQINLSPMQIRGITTKTIEGSYENIFRSCLTVFQDQGYIIKNTDMNSGLIVANIDKETSKGSQFWQQFWAGYIWNKGTQIEVSCMVNKINDTISDVRINIQETDFAQFGNKQNIRHIYDEKLYSNLFNQITTELKRREAMLGKVTNAQEIKAEKVTVK